MTKVLLIGSGNRDKAAELRQLLADSPWTLKALSDFPAIEEPEEVGETFEENALAKADYYSAHFDLPCVADDSGLEVAALEGAPGIYSARYAGLECSYDDNNQKVLARLSNLNGSQRSARFVCCAAYVEPGGARHTEHGFVEGVMAESCRGRHGFGYDPLFVPAGYDQTFAEMAPSEKHKLSHRGRAFALMVAYLQAAVH